MSERKLDLNRKKIQLDLQLNNIYLISNRKQVAVIIDNLLSNAIKYSPDEGVIVLSTLLEKGQLLLTVSDQGVGISDENQSKIFDAFFQGPPPAESLVKGSGLGLTIVKELILRLNGHIALVGNQKQQTGTKISITLPRAFKQKEQD